MIQRTKCVSSASHQVPDRIVTSAWKQHAPFSFWLIETHQPELLVELGTQQGFSYLCFCQQIRQMKTPTRCAAVDTWRGDEHANFYGEEVFENLRRYHDPQYSDFSTLIRSTFEDALELFPNGSIDLLHIDGRHRYEDVRYDYESWKPKLSSRAIVLFHDTQVRERDFGVFRFWEEVSKQFPHFEFKHGHGLGVLGVGEKHRSLYFPLFSAALDDETTRSIQQAYETLGALLDNPGIGRNEICPCGSGKKYKHCHGKLV
jgi:hypothetical protein